MPNIQAQAIEDKVHDRSGMSVYIGRFYSNITHIHTCMDNGPGTTYNAFTFSKSP